MNPNLPAIKTGELPYVWKLADSHAGLASIGVVVHNRDFCSRLVFARTEFSCRILLARVNKVTTVIQFPPSYMPSPFRRICMCASDETGWRNRSGLSARSSSLAGTFVDRNIPRQYFFLLRMLPHTWSAAKSKT